MSGELLDGLQHGRWPKGGSRFWNAGGVKRLCLVIQVAMKNSMGKGRSVAFLKSPELGWASIPACMRDMHDVGSATSESSGCRDGTLMSHSFDS